MKAALRLVETILVEQVMHGDVPIRNVLRSNTVGVQREVDVHYRVAVFIEMRIQTWKRRTKDVGPCEIGGARARGR